MNIRTYEQRFKYKLPSDERKCFALQSTGKTMEHNHEAILQTVRHDLPTDELLAGLSDLFKVFGDSTRMKILFALLDSEICVCAIAELLGMTQSAISHQLKILKNANLVDSRREGKTIYYHLADDHVKTIVAQGFEHLIEEYSQGKKEK